MPAPLDEVEVPSRCAKVDSSAVVGLICRPMEECDVVRVHRIHTDCLQRSLTEHYTTIQIKTWLNGRTPQGYWHSMLSGEEYFVGEHEGICVAFASWRGDELRSLFVCPEKQRSGIGSLLLKHSRRLTETKYVKATLNAVGFYSRFRFQLVSTGFVEKRGVRIPYVQMQRALELVFASD